MEISNSKLFAWQALRGYYCLGNDRSLKLSMPTIHPYILKNEINNTQTAEIAVHRLLKRFHGVDAIGLRNCLPNLHPLTVC